MSLLKNIGVLFTAISVLFSTLSFPITYHYCEGEIAEVAYFVEPDGCDMEMEKEVDMGCEMDATCNDTSNSISKEDCCKDVTKIVTSSVFVSPKVVEIHKVITTFIPFLGQETIAFKQIEAKKSIPNFYPPPEISFDFQAKYQVYLI